MVARQILSLVSGLTICVILFGQAPIGAWRPERLNEPALPNALRIHPKVISGGEPAGEPAFVALKKLGVQTIISVDGAKPQLELARQHGLRYVHLPHGYDGVPDQRVKELAKAVRDLPGPVYIHCHHGKHRSPAAAAVACIAGGLLPAEHALSVLTTAGTSENYRGLYDSARSARRLDSKAIDKMGSDFPEAVKVPPMADAMVQIEHAHDHLKQFAAASWRPLLVAPDLDPAHEALLLKEHYHELARTPDARQQPADFRQLLTAAGQTAESLESQIRDWQKADRPEPLPASIRAHFATATQHCTACHQKFRDIPLLEKRIERKHTDQ